MVFYLSILLGRTFTNGLVASSAYPIILQKELNNSLHMFCSDSSVSNLILQIDTPPWYEIVGRHPRIRLAMACVSKGWGECHL